MESRRDEVRAAYDTIAADYAAAYPSTEPESVLDVAMLEDLVARLRSAVDGAPRVLDAGCGTGRISRWLEDRGCEVVGVDLSPGMLAQARRARPSVPLHEASLTALPFDDGSFDAVVLWYSVIHLTDDELAVAFAEAARVLRPGGLALVASQKGEGVHDVGARLRERGHDVTLLRWHRGPRDLMSALAAAGLERRARMVREAVDGEREGQVVVLACRVATA